jgi:hypothetical protein
VRSLADSWARLGIAATDDRREIKRAYGRALKAIDPEVDPQAFLELREAYDAALQWGTQTPYWEDDDLEEIFSAAEAEGEDCGLATVDPADDLAEETWERWRPEPPAPAEDDGLKEACGKLDRLLFDDPPPPPEQILEAGRAVLAHPALAEVDRLTETESWLAEAICASIPRSDPLVEPAIARFGWKQAERDWRRQYQVETVLARREDRIFLDQCRKGFHVHHRAVEALTRPPPAKLGLAQLGLPAEVGKFLDVVANEHPSVELDLDPESLAWWRANVARRHLPPNFLPWMLAAPAVLTIAAAFAISARGWPLWLLLPVFGLAALATWGALLGKAELDARARRRGAESWEGEARGASGIERLVLAALLLPPCAALLPNGTFWASLTLAVSLALAGLGLRRGWVESSWGASERPRLFLPVVAFIVGATMLAFASPAEAFKLFPPLLAMCWIGSRAFAPVQVRSHEWRPAAWRALLAGSLLCLCLAAAVVVAAVWVGFTPLWALLLVPSAIVGAHLAAAASPLDVHSAEWPLRVVAALIYFATNFLEDDPFWLRLMPAVSAYGLLYAGYRVATILIIETTLSRAESRADE